MAKRMLSRQFTFNQLLQTYILAHFNVPNFPSRKDCEHIENEKSLKEIFGHSSWRSKNRDIFFFIYVLRSIFFQGCMDMELKIFFITFEGFFEWQK